MKKRYQSPPLSQRKGSAALIEFLFPVLFRIGTAAESSIREHIQKYKPSIFLKLLEHPVSNTNMPSRICRPETELLVIDDANYATLSFLRNIAQGPWIYFTCGYTMIRIKSR